MKRLLLIALSLAVCISLVGCAGDSTGNQNHDPNQTTTGTEESVDHGKLVILYTNDAHNAYLADVHSGALGYAALAAYRDRLVGEGKTVILIDGGDAIQGDAVGTLSHGSYLVDIMNQVGYELAVPGNHEFDFGMDIFLEYARKRAKYQYISCNFVELSTGETVFEPYKILEFNGVKVAFVGITTPECLSKSTPTHFKDEQGNFLYGFCQGNNGKDLYDAVQTAIDGAKREGAEYVIAVGHTGTDPSSSPWTSYEIIANTTGLSVYLDGHSHSIIEGEVITDKDDHQIPVCSTGTKMCYIGQVTLDLNTGGAEVELIDGLTEQKNSVKQYCQDIYNKTEDLLEKVVAKSDVDLITHDPDDPLDRVIRETETNLGDLVADAYRTVLEADIGLVNGGGIRAEIPTGPVTYGDIIAVHPYNNSMCVVRVSGQTILDILEMAYRSAGAGEEGSFLHVSGLTLEIDTSIPSGVAVNDAGEFVGITGERRVKNVMVNGVPIDPEKMYTVASHNYMLKNGGGGFTMLQGAELVLDEVCLDNEVLIDYIQNALGGVITASKYGEPFGDGRIVIE